MREGGCSCGEIRYRLTSDPLFTHCCHCLNCQRQTGSAFVINVLIETDRVELLAGEPLPVDVPRGGGKKQRIFRCPTCQVAVFSRYTRAGIRFVRAGTLDDSVERQPRRPHLHAVEAELGRAPGLGAGVLHLLRHEEAVAGGQSRPSAGADGVEVLTRPATRRGGA